MDPTLRNRRGRLQAPQCSGFSWLRRSGLLRQLIEILLQLPASIDILIDGDRRQPRRIDRLHDPGELHDIGEPASACEIGNRADARYGRADR